MTRLDQTKRITELGLPTAGRSLLAVNTNINWRPTYTFFFTLEDHGPVWSCFEDPDIKLIAPDNAVLKRSSVLFDAWVMHIEDDKSFVVSLEGLSDLPAPWTLVLIEQVSPRIDMEIRQLDAGSLAYRVFRGSLTEGYFHSSPIRYLTSDKFTPVFEVQNLIALLLWHNCRLTRAEIEIWKHRKPGSFFSHIWQPPEEAPRRSGGVGSKPIGTCSSRP